MLVPSNERRPHLGACPRAVPTSLICHARSQRTIAKPELTLEAMQSTIQSLEDNVSKLHEALEKKGVNSRGTKDIFGRVFSMPVRRSLQPNPLLLQTHWQRR